MKIGNNRENIYTRRKSCSCCVDVAFLHYITFPRRIKKKKKKSGEIRRNPNSVATKKSLKNFIAIKHKDFLKLTKINYNSILLFIGLNISFRATHKMHLR